MIYVIARIKVPDGRRDDLLAEFGKVVPKVLAEEGCIEYGPWVDLPTKIEIQGPERNDTVISVEQWESLEAFEAHLIAPHMVEFRKATGDMRLRITLEILQPV